MEAQDALRDEARLGTRKPDYTETATAWRCGNGGDGVVKLQACI
jgi:hypothetical protein